MNWGRKERDAAVKRGCGSEERDAAVKRGMRQ
jgi:hypothetical protein